MPSEQLIQNELYTKNLKILDKYECFSLGATTVRTLMSGKYINHFSLRKTLLNKKPDVLILDKNKNIIIYVEQKTPEKFKTETDIHNAITQNIEVAKALHSRIYIVSDGSEFIWVNPQTGNFILDENGNRINVRIQPGTNDKEIANLIHDISLSISEFNDKILKKEYLDPTSLAQKINKILVNLTFASVKTSLYTFVELFLFKYLSDIKILEGENSFQYIANMYKEDYKLVDPSVTDAKILGKYLDCGRATMIKLFPASLDGTSIINGQVFHSTKNKFNEYVSEDNTDKIFREVIQEFEKFEKECGKFINISKDFKSKLFETFMKNSSDKDNMGQFFTPLKIVKQMVEMVDIRENMKICDPACGVGKFLLEAVEDKIPNFYKYSDKDEKIIKKISLTGYEKMMSEGDDITIILAKANMLIYFSEFFQGRTKAQINQLAEELLNETFVSSKKMLGTLSEIEKDKYDLILANPPYYQSKAMSDEAKALGGYDLGASGVEGLFLEWILKSLADGGVANIVLPDGIFSNYANSKIKQYILNGFFIESIISLPVGSFFNTPKKTYILTVRKKTQEQRDSNTHQTYPVFSYIAMSVGETLDNYRFDTEDDDLKEAVIKYNFYRKNSSDLPQVLQEYFDKDKKLKLIPIEDFNSESSWIIENWWTESEKVSLGLTKERNEITIQEFHDLVSDIILDLNNFKEEIKCLM